MRHPLLPTFFRIRGPKAALAAIIVSLGCDGARTEAAPPAPRHDATESDLQNILAEANGVINDADNIQAAKKSKKVFAAAHALLGAGRNDSALQYFERGLQLSPWELEEQLSYAELLAAVGRKKEAVDVAEMVESKAESDSLYFRARRVSEKSATIDGSLFEEKPTEGPCICLVQIGPVNRVVLLDSAKKLHETLGIPVFVRNDPLKLGAPDRSAFDHWVRTEIMPKITWKTAEERNFWGAIGVKSPDQKVDSGVFFAALLAQLKKDGLDKAAENMEDTASFFHQRDQQWDAAILTNQVAHEKRNQKTVLVGISEGDFYAGENNYLFGMAQMGSKCGAVSYARYRADFYKEPPDRARLISRMHKQLLSTIGNALDVPRPTDPTSARSYPNSLSEHDAKSEYMSEQCIAGFERALGVTLPNCAHKHPKGEKLP